MYLHDLKNLIIFSCLEMEVMNMKKGFSLSELLMALTIVGVIAVLTVPVIMNNIQNRIFVTKLKNTVAMIEQLAQQELIKHRTRDLSNTDFSAPDKLLTDKYFSIAKFCSGTTSKKDCWKTTATGKNKVQYKTIKKSNFDDAVGLSNLNTVILKNGVTFSYSFVSNLKVIPKKDITALFYIDINGSEKPNISGRDFYVFYLTNKGRVVDRDYVQKNNSSLNQKINRCKNGNNVDSYICFGALRDNNWKMDY